MRSPLARPSLILLAVFAVLAPEAARACSVPVFRYALDRWPADPYDLIFFHKGTLGEEPQAVVEWLKERDIQSRDGANLLVHTFDVDGEMPETVKRIWEDQKDAELPWLVVRYPRFSRIPVHVWAGKPTMEVAKSLVESPLREKVAKQITEGATAVWLLLESEDKEKNEAAAKTLGEALKKMEELIELPESEVTDPYEAAYAKQRGELKVSFPLVRLSRTDIKERALIDMLLHSEEDLLTFKEPMAFPLFGRGRALYALVGKGIHEDNVADACGFLCGACSCEVKQLNPGVDLLMKVDWEKALYPDLEEPAIEIITLEEGETGAADPEGGQEKKGE